MELDLSLQRKLNSLFLVILACKITHHQHKQQFTTKVKLRKGNYRKLYLLIILRVMAMITENIFQSRRELLQLKAIILHTKHDKAGKERAKQIVWCSNGNGIIPTEP